MAKQAKYTLYVPQADNLGQPLRDMAVAAHQHLFQNGVIEGSTIDRGKEGNWRDYEPELMDLLHAWTEDSPENDSHIKQTAQHIGELANQEAVFVEKHGAAGPMAWVVGNPKHVPGEGAHPSALAPDPGQALVSAFFDQNPAENAPKGAEGVALRYLEQTAPPKLDSLRSA